MSFKTFFSSRIMLYILLGTRKLQCHLNVYRKCQNKFKTVSVESKKISNDQELIQADPTSYPGSCSIFGSYRMIIA